MHALPFHLTEKEEWYRVSDYSSNEVAALTLARLDPDWIPRGLILVPTLSDKNTRGAFSLEVHSDVPGRSFREAGEGRSFVGAN